MMSRSFNEILTFKVLNLNHLFELVSICRVYLFASDDWDDAITYFFHEQSQISAMNLGSNDICNIMHNPNDVSEDKRQT